MRERKKDLDVLRLASKGGKQKLFIIVRLNGRIHRFDAVDRLRIYLAQLARRHRLIVSETCIRDVSVYVGGRIIRVHY